MTEKENVREKIEVIIIMNTGAATELGEATATENWVVSTDGTWTLSRQQLLISLDDKTSGVKMINSEQLLLRRC